MNWSGQLPKQQESCKTAELCGGKIAHQLRAEVVRGCHMNGVRTLRSQPERDEDARRLYVPMSAASVRREKLQLVCRGQLKFTFGVHKCIFAQCGVSILFRLKRPENYSSWAGLVCWRMVAAFTRVMSISQPHSVPRPPCNFSALRRLILGYSVPENKGLGSRFPRPNS